MAKGRPPVPAETRRLRGESQKSLPVVVGGRRRPPVPAHLDANMLECWNYIVDDMDGADLLDHADAGVIESAAVFWARARQARAAMETESLLVQTPQGVIPNRLLDVERQSWKEFRALAETLPLSPWGRARLGLKPGPKGQNSTDDIGLPPRLRAI